MGRPPKKLPLSDDEIIEMYESGQSMKAISERCGLRSPNPVARVLRGSGVLVRGHGPVPGSRARLDGREKRACKRDECDNTFPAYPSSNKRYCSPGCRTSCPELRASYNPQAEKHRLSGVDEVAKIATCSACGPTRVRRRSGKPDDSPIEFRWRCSTYERSRRLAAEYGLSAEDVSAMIADQGSACGVCRYPFIEKSFHVDHDHESGEVRGLLCSNCNTALGLLGDNINTINSAALYLRGVKPWEQ